jgi:hypothetical protein
LLPERRIENLIGPYPCVLRPQHRLESFSCKTPPTAPVYHWCKEGGAVFHHSSTVHRFTRKYALSKSGAEGIRTPDLRRAKAALGLLSITQEFVTDTQLLGLRLINQSPFLYWPSVADKVRARALHLERIGACCASPTVT